ncbi:GLPGLI family protein [Lutibacter flavus]|uniref:GLPGLI family protein n=1 Tax=Lutibacter flavus TaxID=691689 RepID=A0A238ZHY4_9FLAO|nr:GLPGLI family protein [Lutibacter flavus]SNR82830.1 GLPGLI family protein [Lutibacter flavus]
MKIIITFFLILSVYSISFCQEGIEGRAYYLKQNNFQFDKNRQTQNESEIKSTLNSLDNNFQFILEFITNESIFKLEDKLNLSDYEMRLAKMFGGRGVYYSDLDNNESIHQVESFGQLFLKARSFNEIKWKLLNETKLIGNFLCYKAITVKIVENDKIFKKQVEAWYCPEIPASFGPIGYGGLPGLIIELSIENEAIYSMNKLELNPKGKVEIMKPAKGKRVTEKEYNEIGKSLFERMKKGKF